jgi:ribosomal protein S18 acetylase RimI-like enzyme
MRLPAGRGESPSLALHIAPVSLERDADRQAVMTLAAQCRSADPAGHFAPAGLLSELNGRPGRVVSGWLAWPVGQRQPAAAANGIAIGPLGLVALVTAGELPRPRFSIAWLLVDPEARRQGIASALAEVIAYAPKLHPELARDAR